MYLGAVQLGSTLSVWVQVTNASGTPVSASPDPPAMRVYGPGGTSPRITVTSMGSEIDSQTGWHRYDISITEGNGFAAGENCVIRVTYAISGPLSRAEVLTFDVV